MYTYLHMHLAYSSNYYNLLFIFTDMNGSILCVSNGGVLRVSIGFSIACILSSIICLIIGCVGMDMRWRRKEVCCLNTQTVYVITSVEIAVTILRGRKQWQAL